MQKLEPEQNKWKKGGWEGRRGNAIYFLPSPTSSPFFRSRANACYAGYKFIVKTTSGMWFTRMTDGTTRTPDSNRDFPNNF